MKKENEIRTLAIPDEKLNSLPKIICASCKDKSGEFKEVHRFRIISGIEYPMVAPPQHDGIIREVTLECAHCGAGLRKDNRLDGAIPHSKA